MTKIVPLSNEHKKEDFECGNEALDNYIRKQAKQDMKRDLSACFVLPSEDGRVKGYYTLSSNSAARKEFPEELSKKLPFYGDIPTTLLGRLARDLSTKGEGLGEILLIDALKRCYEASQVVASWAVVVDPIDDKAHNFYQSFDFIELPGSKRMFLPMKTIEKLLKI